MAGIVAELPAALISTLELGKNRCFIRVINIIISDFSSISNSFYCFYGKRTEKNNNSISKKTNWNESNARSVKSSSAEN